jgi:hypothetical protein
MSEAEHTAGPWQFREQGDANEFAVLDSTGRWLFSIRHNGEELLAKQLANMRLVAAAPAVFTCLQGLMGCPYDLDENTISEDGIEAAPMQVVGVMSVALLRRRRALAAIALALGAA